MCPRAYVRKASSVWVFASASTFVWIRIRALLERCVNSFRIPDAMSLSPNIMILMCRTYPRVLCTSWVRTWARLESFLRPSIKTPCTGCPIFIYPHHHYHHHHRINSDGSKMDARINNRWIQLQNFLISFYWETKNKFYFGISKQLSLPRFPNGIKDEISFAERTSTISFIRWLGYECLV